MEKKILSKDELNKKVSDIINSYSNKDNNSGSLRSLIYDLLDVYNDSVIDGREETIMLTWVANFPDN
jgi:hypothetical protein